MRVLVTGAAGFIGYHVARRLAERGDAVVGVDNLNAYYDVSLKEARLALLGGLDGFEFVRADLADRAAMDGIFAGERFDAIVNLAAQAGVRYSIENPRAYVDSNLVGFANVLEGARAQQTGHLVFASTSSVYGANTALPFAETQNTDHPVSIYSATKKANEAMAHSYAHLFRIPCTGLRFFTVYGPWGRPDMALFKFTRAILAGEPIKLFNEGRMTRDFTYVDDIVEGVVRVTDRPAAPDPDGIPTIRRRIRAAPRGGSSTSATTSAWSSWTTSAPSRKRSASRRGSNTCRCSRATCRRPRRMSPRSRRTPASGRRPRSQKGCAASSPGTATISNKPVSLL
jgi:UDP-glucuronate 4-epimerase